MGTEGPRHRFKVAKSVASGVAHATSELLGLSKQPKTVPVFDAVITENGVKLQRVLGNQSVREASPEPTTESTPKTGSKPNPTPEVRHAELKQPELALIEPGQTDEEAALEIAKSRLGIPVKKLQIFPRTTPEQAAMDNSVPNGWASVFLHKEPLAGGEIQETLLAVVHKGNDFAITPLAKTADPIPQTQPELVPPATRETPVHFIPPPVHKAAP